MPPCTTAGGRNQIPSAVDGGSAVYSQGGLGGPDEGVEASYGAVLRPGARYGMVADVTADAAVDIPPRLTTRHYLSPFRYPGGKTFARAARAFGVGWHCAWAAVVAYGVGGTTMPEGATRFRAGRVPSRLSRAAGG